MSTDEMNWRDFPGRDGRSTLTICPCGDVIEIAARDTGNDAAAEIPIDDIWDVIDYLIEIAGPRAFGGGA